MVFLLISLEQCFDKLVKFYTWQLKTMMAFFDKLLYISVPLISPGMSEKSTTDEEHQILRHFWKQTLEIGEKDSLG